MNRLFTPVWINMTTRFLVFLLLLAFNFGCQPTTPAPPAAQTAPAGVSGTLPPTPPVVEDFEKEPKLSLFPRIGDYRPADDQLERLRYWKTYLEHVTKTSGPLVIPPPQQQAGRVFALRSVADLESVGFFTPLQVKPGHTYEVSLWARAELPPGGIFGVGIIEFDQFLWVEEQYTEALVSTHRTAIQQGLELRGQHPWQERQFRFTTSPRTGMVHLVFYREGQGDRIPVLLDDIRIEEITP